MQKARLSALKGPMVFAAIAIGLATYSYRAPNWIFDLGPIDLTQGASKVASFRVPSDDRYAIALELDQKEAIPLLPCAADSAALDTPACNKGSSIWPPQMAFRISSGGRDYAQSVQLNIAGTGGERLGRKKYIWNAAYIYLHSWTEYELKAVSGADSASLASAHPRLVVTAAPEPEDLAVRRLGGFFIAALFGFGAVLWAGWVSWPKRAG
jgi:hypothetical protein